MAEPRASLVFRFPKWLDDALHWWDLGLNRIDETWLHRIGFLRGYSALALWLPIPLIVFLTYGLPAYFLPPWRGTALFVVVLAAVLVHVLLCRFARGLWLLILQWLLLIAAAIGVLLFAPDDARHWDATPYPHVYAILGVLVLTVSMPISRWLAGRLFARQQSDMRAVFSALLQETQLFIGGDTPADSWSRVRRALSLTLVSAPVLLATVPALFVVVSPRVLMWQVACVALVWWCVLASAFYNERMTKFRELLHGILLTGWPLILSFFVIAVAAARLLDVSYVTAVLDQPGTSGLIVGGLLLAYWLFWQHDYWEERSLAEALIDLLRGAGDHEQAVVSYRRGRLQIHGSGRLIAIREVTGKGHEEEFQSYRPLQVFTRMVHQLEGRARSEADPAARAVLWQSVGRAEHLLDTLKQKIGIYYALLLVPPSVLAVVASLSIFSQQQEPGLRVSSREPESVFDLAAALQSGSPDLPRYAVAASGGGTRAALYTYALMRGLKERGVLGQVVAVSGVSGGSLGLAHFAVHRKALLREATDAQAWRRYRDTVAAPHIQNVLAGTGELRLVTGTRLGELLTESFIRELHGGSGRRSECFPSDAEEARVLGDLNSVADGVGVIFNTAVSGGWEGGAASAACMDANATLLGRWFDSGMRNCATVSTSGSRLAVTNISSATEESFRTRTVSGWTRDLDYVLVRDPSTCIAAAAALSANFPPVFSNGAVHVDGDPSSRYWVTDGGAVDNRGVISLLLALRAQLQLLRPDGPTPEALALPPIKVLVAEASAFSIKYSEDRGVGAKLNASAEVADKLIAELAFEVDALYRELTKARAGVEIVYVPMPDTLRVSGAFGTNWAMPASIKVRDPRTWFLPEGSMWNTDGAAVVELDEAQLLALADVMFSSQPVRDGLGFGAEFWAWIGAGNQDPRELLDRALEP